ncbi:MAG: efflux RND transporter periplasmic adaptor subunit [Lachnospiraceae bacterium]|nr:efflux RND transporter periplasmic adaptor subunit [Lachnospiraceae bacterium]
MADNKEMNVTSNGKKKSKKKVIIIVAVVVVALIGVGIVGVSVIKSMTASMEEAMSMMAGEDDALYTVEKVDVKQEITTSGSVIGLEKNAYTSPVTALVADVPVEAGQLVKKGDVLLVYDTTDLGDNLAKVQLQAKSERAAGNAAYEAVNEASGKVKDAKAEIKDLKSDIKALNKEIKELTNTISTYEAKIKVANAGKSEEEYDPTAGLTAKELKQYNKAVSNLEKKNKSLASKQEELAKQEAIVEANEGVKVSGSEATQISVSNQLSDMNVNEAQEQVDTAEAGIVALADGIVESVEIVKGTYANETQTLMTIINADKIGVEFSISKDDLTAVTEGQKARVVIADKEYTGKVVFVSRVATMDANALGTSSSGGSIKGRIELDNPDENIFVGVSAKAYIFIGESVGALAVPYSALCTDVDGDYVLVVNDNNIIERKDITVGLYSGDYYEVLEGLAEGDKVITEVTKNMKPGDEYVPSMAAPGMTMY